MTLLFYIYVVLVLPYILWKGWHAWRRTRATYQQDIAQHGSLREYLLGNGATTWQARRPFLRHAVERAWRPIARQWRFWLIVIALGVLLLILK